MADGVLGLGNGAASLNQELIDKLKEAERGARVEPLETSLEDWEVENTSIDTINTKITELLASIRPFDLYVTGGVTAFDQKMANTTGSSVVFDAEDVTKLNTGTTNVTVNSLATKDVFQSNTFSSADDIVSFNNDIVIDGKLYSTNGEDFDALVTQMQSNYTTVSYDSNANTIDIDGTVFSTEGKTYSDLSVDINANANHTASTHYMSINGEVFTTNEKDFEALATEINTGSSTASFDKDNNQLTVNGVVFDTASKSYEQIASEIDAEGTSSTTANYIKINDDIFSIDGKTYEEMAELINKNSAYTASVEEVGTDTFRMVIKSTESGLDNALSITQKGFDLGLNQFASSSSVTGSDSAGDGNTLTLNGTTFTVNASETYDAFIARIDADVNFDASIEDGVIQIKRTDGSALEVTNDELNLNLVNNNHTLNASNMNAVIDGIEYNVSSNELVVGGGLKITAVELGDASINVQKDTALIETQVQNVVTLYNELVDLIDGEVLSAESKVEDKSVLRTVLSDIKNILFGNYGLDEDKNLFNFGFSTDKTGYLTVDSTEFAAVINEDLDSLKTLFVGVAEKEGLGTQLKSYIDSVQGFDGLFSVYQESLTDKKEVLEEEKEKAIEDLDDKYSQMAQQFASYNVIINQMEASFSGLKMMIQQSVASN